MTLDSDVVVWTLRGFDPERRGLPAHEIARFIARDATLSDRYTSCDVTTTLEALVAEGVVECVNGGDGPQADSDESRDATITYRLATVADASFFAISKPLTTEARHDALVDTATDTGAISAERDAYKLRAEAAEEQLLRARHDIEALRTRVQALKSALAEQERALTLRRTETARRAAMALERAQNELQQLTPSNAVEPVARRPRGNWLR